MALQLIVEKLYRQTDSRWKNSQKSDLLPFSIVTLAVRWLLRNCTRKLIDAQLVVEFLKS